MGKSITPKYRIIVDGQVMSWDGKPTQKALEHFVFSYAKSLEHGGCNEHISKQIGYVPYPINCKIETNTQYKPVTMAAWKAAPFQVYS